MSEHSSALRMRIAQGGMAAVLAMGLSVAPLCTTEAHATPSSKQAEAQAALTTLNAMKAKLKESEANYEAAMEAQIEAQEKMDEAQDRIDEATERITSLQEHLGVRARSMYMSGSTDFLDILLGAATFQAFTTNWDMLNTMNQSDADMVSETKELREEVTQKKAEYAEQKQVADEKAEEMKAIVEESNALVAQQQAVYDTLSAEAAAIVAREQAAAEASGSNGTTSNSSSSGNKGTSSNQTYDESNLPSAPPGASSRVSRAYSVLGKPYVYGSSGPDSFDCSGLVSYCINNGTRYTSGSFSSGPFTNNPVPGDICWESGHVGIYIGNNQMIHAPEPGKNVCIATVHSGMKFVRK